MFDLDMETVYFGSAAIGAGLLVLLLAASAFGGDAEADFDGDVDLDAAEGAGGVSVRTLVAFLTFFGVAGMAATRSGVAPVWSGVIAILSGSLAFWVVGLLMAQLHRLRSSGNVELGNAVGAEARVYLAIPGAKAGEGKVTVPIQGRTAELRAITTGRALKTGEYCRVIAVHGVNTVEVEAPEEA